jgi:hypothetical protein
MLGEVFKEAEGGKEQAENGKLLYRRSYDYTKYKNYRKDLKDAKIQPDFIINFLSVLYIFAVNV